MAHAAIMSRGAATTLSSAHYVCRRATAPPSSPSLHILIHHGRMLRRPRAAVFPAAAGVGGALLQDAGATALVFGGAYALVSTFDNLTRRNIIEQKLSRKLVHIFSGLLFLASWPIFSTSTGARYFAALVPLVNCLRLVINGLSLSTDEGLIKSVSREGKAEELLRGPLYYVLMLILCAVFFWRDSPVGMISLAMMCGGDGIADIMGRKFGSLKISYNPQKSWAGSISMFLFGFLVSICMLYYFSALGYVELDWMKTVERVALVSLVASFVESLPTNGIVDDNISVPLASIITSFLVFGIAYFFGYRVSGSDIAWSSYMDALKEAGASLYLGHSERNVLRNGDGSSLPDAVVVSSAIPPENVEVLIAKSLLVPVYKRGAWLGKITKDYNLIAVSGSHGKSTTTSMLAYVLKAMGDDLTAVIGAQVPQFSGGNVIYGDSCNFVLEADEYDSCFLDLSPIVAIVTNLDWEHVDIYKDEEAVKKNFRKFIGRVRTEGHLIIYGDKHGQSLGVFSLLNHHSIEVSDATNYAECLSAQLCANKCNITTFGMSSCCNWQASSVSPNSHGGSDYQLCYNGYPVTNISLQIPGDHNVLNSLAVIAALSVIFGDDRLFYNSIDSVKSHLKNFKGISRRFELIGKIHGCRIFDDYAHHPTEVRSVLQAARRMFPLEELLVVFQPHTYSRLAALRSEFASAFTEAYRVIITEVYAARETNVWNIGGEDLAMSVTSPTCNFIPRLENVVSKLVDIVSKDVGREIVILTLGAGDITLVGRKLLQELEQIL